MSEQRLTVTLLAERVGVHKSTVSRQARAWGLMDADGLIDPAAYIARRAELDPALQRKPQPAAKGAGYASAKAEREQHLAELAGLEVRKRRGEMIDRAAVSATLQPKFRELRDALLAVPRDHVLNPDEAAACEEAVRDLLTRFCDCLETLSASDVVAELPPMAAGAGGAGAAA